MRLPSTVPPVLDLIDVVASTLPLKEVHIGLG
jgi:hypothetical protein